MSERQTLNWPYMADITLQTPTRSSPYTYQALTQTNETLVVDQAAVAPLFVSDPDKAQSGYADFMDLADRMASQIDEQIETYVWQQHGDWDNFDGATIGGSAGSITVSLTNVDDIIRNVRKQIFTAKGGSLLDRNGGFIVWKPGDFEKLEGFAQANGFQLADQILRNGVKFGIRYGGFDHYVSNRLVSGHGAAGVKKVIKVGLLSATYGNLMVDEKHPNSLRGTGLVLSADYGVKTFNFGKSLIFDIAVA